MRKREAPRPLIAVPAPVSDEHHHQPEGIQQPEKGEEGQWFAVKPAVLHENIDK
jgi:hypothetical protein